MEDKKENTFSLCVFGSYEIEYTCIYSYLDECGDFSDGKDEKHYSADGGQFIESIAKLMFDKDCIIFNMSENEIYIELFNPDNGTGAEYLFKIKELREAEND